MGQPVVRILKASAERVDIFTVGKTAQPDAQSAVDGSCIKPHGFQNMAPPALFAGGAF